MSKQTIITGIKVTDQMAKAMEILNTEVLPKENLFQDRKRKGILSKEYTNNSDSGCRPASSVIDQTD